MAKRIRSFLGLALALSLFESGLSFVPTGANVNRERYPRTRHDESPLAFRPSRHQSQQQQQHYSRRFLLSASASTNNKKSATKSRVVYQKVVRPPSELPDILFLGYLVEYLQEQFDLPERLPMVYEKAVAGDNDDNDDDGDYDSETPATPTKEQRYLVSWDSSLSPSSDATRMSVEVVGIYTDDDNDNAQKETSSPSVPNMAMVVVHKDSSSVAAFQKLPPMLQNLFKDSESRILKALDRGLDDFVAGKIELDSISERVEEQYDAKQAAQNAMLADLMDDEDYEDDDVVDVKASRKPPMNVVDADVIDAQVVVESDTVQEQVARKEADDASRKSKRKAALETMKTESVPASKPPQADNSAPGLDFAVQAAKRAAAKRQKNIKAEDFAVAAAKKAAAKSATKKVPKQAVAKSAVDIPKETENSPLDLADIDVSTLRPPMLDQDANGSRAFRQTISRPGDRGKKSQNASSKKRKVADMPAAPVDSSAGKRATQEVPSDASVNAVESSADDFDTVSREALEREIEKATQDALEELANEGEDQTPEELLGDILKFGEQKEKESSEGGGFVSGAFEKAKEILREQQQRRDDRLRNEVVARVAADLQGLAPDVPEGPPQVEFKELSPEEELRRMFEAGERIADGRITMQTGSSDIAANDDQISAADEKRVDSVIAADRTVSGHARVLDDELAELEVRINSSPGEEFDSPSKNPMFDIFSGPELYNPNVDPETAVNWPGAQQGTKQIRLPKQLDEAVSQAKFASEVLSGVRETVDEAGQKKYTVGERELTEQQVQNLQTVVSEAVEIGILADPLTLMAERSRLQMLVDELRDQPEERIREVTSSYKDLLLSDNFVPLIKERLIMMADRDLEALRQDDDSLESTHSRERQLLGQLVVYAQLLLKETKALGAELEAQQLEVIRSICKVAMDPSHQTEEETADALSDVVKDMRPLFDEGFIAYLKYAVAEEEGRLARKGVLDDPEHNQWLFVLKIVQQGVYAEIAQGIKRYIDHIWYVLRMESPPERRMLLSKLIDVLPTLDVRPFVQVVENIAGSLGDSADGEFSDFTALGEMTNKILQLRRDVKELLPPERIALMSRDADEWAANRKKQLLEQQKLSKQRLQAARATAHLDGEIESLGRRGEMERIE